MMELFSVTDEQLKKINVFVHKHCMCGKRSAIGGAITYEFAPTSLGVVVKVKCHCGANIDVSDYENW